MPPTLFDRLRDILESDEVGLRELARLAGGDPRTFYIGTALDGVDIRGQDLRGLALPGLDPHKALRDSGTRLDGEAPAPQFRGEHTMPDEGHAAILVLAPGSYRTRHAANHSVIWSGYRDSVSQFLAVAGERHAAFLLTDRRRIPEAAEAARQLKGSGRGGVVILLDSRGRRGWQKDAVDLAHAGGLPVVTVFRSAGQMGSALAGEVLDLITLLSPLGERPEKMLPSSVTAFLRARGTGPDHMLDAAAQLADRLETAHSDPYDALLLRNGELDHLGPAVQALLPVAEAHQAPSPTEKRFDLAVFARAHPAGHLTDFDARVRSSLEALGWRVFPSLNSSRTLFMMENATGSLVVDVVTASQKLRRRRQDRIVGPRRLEACSRLVVSPRAEVSLVGQKAWLDGELWVSVRDLVALPSHATSVWPLIQAQARRVGRSMPSAGRSLYVRMLLSSAFHDGAVDHRSAALLRAISVGEIEGVLGITGPVDAGPEETRLRVTVDLPGAEGVIEPSVQADIVVDGRGVSVFDFGERLLHRPGFGTRSPDSLFVPHDGPSGPP